MTDLPPITNEDRRLLRIYEPKIADKPIDRFTVGDTRRLVDILRYVGRRQTELSVALGHLLNVWKVRGKRSPEAKAAAEDIQREFAADWEALENAPWPYVRMEDGSLKSMS